MMRRFAFSAPCFAGTRSASTLKSHGIIERMSVKSVSKWTWPFCQQFVELVHDPTLSLPTGKPLVPAAEVFAELDIDDKLLLNPPKTKQVFEHCEIEKVMKRMNIPAMADGSPNPSVLERNQAMVDQLARARREEKAEFRHEKKIDQCAQHFLVLCGFDNSPFTITAEGADFKIFGKTCYSDGDHYVVVTPNNDLVLVFEDKSLKEGEVLAKHGHLGQIVGELHQMMSLNRVNKKFHSVFAVRFINYRVTAFRVCPSKATLRTLCDTREVPATPLQLLCTEATPTTSLGLSLIDKTERLQGLKHMADIRQFILDNKT
jgi:hypothetical protein